LEAGGKSMGRGGESADCRVKARGFAEGLLEEDYDKHRNEFKNKNMTSVEYDNKAKNLLNSEIGGDILGFTSEKRRIYRYNKKENEFGICEPNGDIACFYRPTGGIDYWYRQVKVYEP
jgi:pyocin large subunit-like protein